MKSLFLGTLQIHSSTNNALGYAISPGTEGLDFPEIRRNAYNKPGEYGAYLTSLLYGGRRIQLEGAVFANNVAAFELLRRQLGDAVRINKDTNSRPLPTSLKITTMDDLALQTDVYINAFKMAVTNLMGAKFMIDLYSPDFALFSQALNSKTLTRASGGGAVYPFIYPQIYGASVGGQDIAVNAGDAETFPIIYLNGAISNPIIQNVTNGRYIELGLTLAATDQVIIDMKNKTIIKNGNTSVISNKTSPSQFFWLEKGANTIKFFTSSGADNGNMQIQWRDAYLGI